MKSRGLVLLDACFSCSVLEEDFSDFLDMPFMISRRLMVAASFSCYLLDEEFSDFSDSLSLED
jgi:hypothetical protein